MKYQTTEVITSFDRIDRGDLPQGGNRPRSLVLRGITRLGQQDVEISETAAAELMELLEKHLQASGSR
jgi:hypothetical protein